VHHYAEFFKAIREAIAKGDFPSYKAAFSNAFLA